MAHAGRVAVQVGVVRNGCEHGSAAARALWRGAGGTAQTGARRGRARHGLFPSHQPSHGSDLLHQRPYR
eukprot:5389883-Alexandrium_andersonii.AAC.1